jgi:hypothetical protein
MESWSLKDALTLPCMSAPPPHDECRMRRDLGCTNLALFSFAFPRPNVVLSTPPPCLCECPSLQAFVAFLCSASSPASPRACHQGGRSGRGIGKLPPQTQADDLSLLEKEEIMWSKTVELGGDTIILPLLVTTDLLGQGLVIVRVPLYRPSLLHAHALVGGARRTCGAAVLPVVGARLFSQGDHVCSVAASRVCPVPKCWFSVYTTLTWSYVGCVCPCVLMCGSPFPRAPLHARDPPPMSCLRDPRPCPTSGPLCTSTPPRPTARQLYRCPQVALWTPWCPCPPWHRYVL